MPVLNKSFTVNHPQDQVWSTFQDLELIVNCVPGASLVEPPQGNTVKGRMTVKLGPVKADFGGEAEVETDPSSYTGTITGRGVDQSHASRAKGEVVYRLSEAAEGGTNVAVDVDYSLSGSLAQFARGGIVEAVADQIIQDFVANLESELNSSSSGTDTGTTGQPSSSRNEEGQASAEPQKDRGGPKKSNELNALSLLWSIIRSKIGGLFGRR